MAANQQKINLAPGARITGEARERLAAQLVQRYEQGESIRAIATDLGRSYGWVQGMLKQAGVTLRGRGGPTRGAAGEERARVAWRTALKPVGNKQPAADVEQKAPLEAVDLPTKPSKVKKPKESKPKETKAKSEPATSQKPTVEQTTVEEAGKPGKKDKSTKADKPDKADKKKPATVEAVESPKDKNKAKGDDKKDKGKKDKKSKKKTKSK